MTTDMLFAHLRFQFHRHGWPAAVGLLLILGAIVWELFAVPALRTEAIIRRAEQSELGKQLAEQSKPHQTSANRLEDLYASLPADSAALAAVQTIHHAAAANGVNLPYGDYRLARDASNSLLRYQITLPARASYPQLRAWLSDVMNALPTAALDEISFQRDDVATPLVESRMRLTIFLKAG